MPDVGSGALLSATVALVLVLAAFVARGGVRLQPTTWVEIGLMITGAALAVAACLTPRSDLTERLHGGWALLAFALLAAYTALSIVWSLAPSDSWLEANRTFAYLATFVGAMALVRLFGDRWAAVLHGVVLGTVAICGWALLTKVFPGALAADEVYARLRAPFEYWNSVGLTAALGVPGLMWLAARRSGYGVANALAWPALGVLMVCMMLSYSRGSLLAVGIGIAVWLIAVPLRLRAVAALVCSAVAAAPVVLWAFAQDGLTTDRAPLAARADAGHELGALLLLLIAVLTFAGLAVGFLGAYRPPSERTRRLAGRGLLGALALVPVVVLLALATAPGGISGQTSKAWTQVMDPQARTPANTPDRLTATSSVRARYWEEALKVHGDSRLVGTGAGAYATMRNRYRQNGDVIVRHAHGYGVQTLADLGWIGLGLSLLAALAWLLSAAWATGLRRRDRGLPFDAERVGLLTMAAIVVVFGIHSLLDWTWFVPGNVVPALLCAGWVAGRGPLRTRLTASGEAPAEAPRSAATAAPHGRLGALRARLPRWTPPPARGAAAVLIAALALIAAWAAYQPLRSVRAGDAALERVGLGNFEAAVSIANIAVQRNPLSVDPLLELAAIEQGRGQIPAAQDALERAVRVQPASAEAWRRLGRFKLYVLDQPRAALKNFEAAYYLDPQSRISWSDLIVVNRRLKSGVGGAGEPTGGS